MSKRKTDAGLEYMIELGFNPAKSDGGVEDQLREVSDKMTARKIMDVISNRTDGNEDNNASFYPLKNQSYEISMALSSAYDGDILRKACNWVVKNKDYFGDEILEIGCDCGIMSCFLAKMFPTSKIMSIDRCQEGIENAKILAKKIGVDNVEFLCADVADIAGQYDTVFSMRTVHENHTDHEKEDLMNELVEQSEIFKNSLIDYAHVLSSKLAENGLLISIERIGRNALLLGWMEALEEAGLVFAIDTYEELICKEIGTDSTFEAFISFKMNKETISAYELFMHACNKYMDFDLAQYGGWDAKIVFDSKHGDLIEGYYIENTSNHQRSMMSLWTHRYDETGLIVYQNNEGNVFTGFFDISQKDELLQSLKDAISEAGKNSWNKITEIRK